ncbi:MAG: OB-fold nucleic acid binding domain-containing protein [Tetrasphaera jenkinsii]|jgi:RecG-like helicase|uniref:Nucleic acid binding OB-fold tRNA/helicase-type n=1 Tax=Nostocoides jenkinsii Ben 74 TaxID=1193518 RepID=A0A077MDL6_9MICO|nr:OB-fold nucleic acid binding domain-containing protein [Tetrasphaera jenkinsii]MCI1261391.1 OB-fold nucleic acid binding domain-containing protein [Tetrasphaera jenkinsii]CCI52982.1 Nucleic acid binding OB-fold tRNA/helicase-type [Tetrasphaera jenkinsii Ben 74]
MSGGGLLRRLSERFTQTADEAEAADVRRRSHSTGAHEIAALADRQVATVAGKVRSVTLRPQSTVPALVVDLDDGSQVLVLVWLGRRKIRGIEPGTFLRATGRVCYREERPTIFNPAYELLPRRAE